MDPTSALLLALRALSAHDREAAIDSLVSLADWLDHGGFFPRVEHSAAAFTDHARVYTFTLKEERPK